MCILVNLFEQHMVKYKLKCCRGERQSVNVLNGANLGCHSQAGSKLRYVNDVSYGNKNEHTSYRVLCFSLP